MVTVLARFRVRTGKLPLFQELCGQLIAATRREPGCISYELFQSHADAAEMCFIEYWQSQADLDAHAASEHFTLLVPQLAALCEDAPLVQTFGKVL